MSGKTVMRPTPALASTMRGSKAQTFDMTGGERLGHTVFIGTTEDADPHYEVRCEREGTYAIPAG